MSDELPQRTGFLVTATWLDDKGGAWSDLTQHNDAREAWAEYHALAEKDWPAGHIALEVYDMAKRRVVETMDIIDGRPVTPGPDIGARQAADLKALLDTLAKKAQT